ncbi:hypothetical protein CVT25_005289 [Psilocybe cyanescens]|uniref:Uncharacterized protein n=1 Tax=Psilocybe cyanescens TaxID=93625 RepID=A0A409XBQ3_PSICY|nr:hypothetical protein CVT25_005289 [Psilocybe cyanescens]
MPTPIIASGLTHYSDFNLNAQKNRWHEEVVLVVYEMQWTVRYFIHHREEWAQATQMEDINLGLRAYTYWQSTMWYKYVVIADHAFKNRNNLYLSPFI